MYEENDIKRDNIYDKLLKTKIAKNYYDCLFNNCKKKFVDTHRYFLINVEKEDIKKYKKPQIDLLYKYKLIINKNIKDINEKDLLILINKNEIVSYAMDIYIEI